YAAAAIAIGPGRRPCAATRKRQASARSDQDGEAQDRIVQGSSCASGGVREHAGRGLEGAAPASRGVTGRLALKPQTVELELSPVDNRALANLCGALDANLRQVEAALDVTIARRGSALTVRGASPQVQQAATALQRFYAHASEPLSVDDI